MNDKLTRERLGGLFNELEQLAASSPGDSPELKPVSDEAGNHLLEMEKQEPGGKPAQANGEDMLGVPQEPAHARAFIPQLYEKEQGGFSYSDGKLAPVDRQDSVATDKNTIAAPLTIGSEVIGELQIAPRSNQSLNNHQIHLTRAVAEQVSRQIQNLKLLTEAERSRFEAEAATRRFVHEGWDSYLDAIQRNERIGYIYNRSAVARHDKELLPAERGVQIPVNLTDEQIGMVYVEPGATHSFSQPDTALIQAVADQVAQQVENIRLLADASRARAEAEQAIRRVARENWQNFASDHEESGFAFVYDSLHVTKQDEYPVETELDLVKPLVVQGEVIGQLGVKRASGISREDARLADTLAAQVSIHLETLRLNAELEKRARELQELDRVKSAFLANMSHELRTPLNSILGFSDVMLEGLDGELTEYMDNDLRLIQKNGRHLLNLINDILDMSKIESGRMSLHPESFNIYNTIHEVCSITSSLASEKNIALFIEDDSARDIEIYADDTRIRQVMINLVNNAIKFTEKGKIALALKRLDCARILITVKDTGIGIPLDKLEMIFQEFTQVDTSTTRKVGGTGLGLPISRRLVEMHGGRLWAESTGVEGQGSTFFVELPLEAKLTDVVEMQEKEHGGGK